MEARKALGLRAGDTVSVVQKVVEKGTGKEGKDKTRLQTFEGLILAVKHGSEPGSTFTVRRVIDGVGVERIFTLYSPLIDSIDILRRARVRRAKLYHVRDKAAKEIRRQMKHELNIQPKDTTPKKITPESTAADVVSADAPTETKE